MGIRHHTVRWIWVFIWQLSLIPSPANFPVCLDFPFLTEYFEREKEHDDAEVVTDLGREVYKVCEGVEEEYKCAPTSRLSKIFLN